jgi:hypothetical protein
MHEAVVSTSTLSLAAVIRQQRDEYADRGIPARDIGNGWCGHFADDVLSRWVGPDWIMKDGSGFQEVETGQFVVRDDDENAVDWDWSLLAEHWNMRLPRGVDSATATKVACREPVHIWITVDGRHYDAESPDGVDSFFDLAFFRRWLGLDVIDVP